MKIIYKLILGFLAIALWIAVAGYISVYTSQKILQKTIGENSISLAFEILDKMDRYIYSYINEFQAYSHDLILQETVLESNQEFEKLTDIQGYINKQNHEWSSAPKNKTTPFMKKLMDNRLSKELREKINFYEEKNGYKVVNDVIVTNKYGANTAITERTTDYRQDDKEWWQHAKKYGSYVGDVTYDKSADAYYISIGTKMDNEKGNFIGAIRIILNIKEVVNIIKESEPTGMHKGHKTMHFKLVTKDGKLIFSTNKFTFFEDISKEIAPYFGPKEGSSHAGDFHRRKEKLFSHAHSKGYKDYKGLGWILIIEHDVDEIFAPVTKLKNNILLISMSITILAILMGFFISSSIAKPILKLKNVTTEISNGNMDANIEIESNDEIGKLAASFNKMTENLKKSTDELIGQRTALKERNSELSALYEISSAISRTINMDKLLYQILDTLTRLEVFHLERRGGIFIVEGGRMNLAAHLGHTKAFLNIHKGIKVGDCLCGLAAKTGEIVISKNSAKDSRHTFTYSGITPHGHIIVPLKAMEKVIGVLCLYFSPDADIDERKIAIFRSIGSQIGIAIENSKLYEETKALSLHDPLTWLANRRLMHIIFEKNLAEAKRFNKPFSALMLDIDNFKTYNDMKGHAAGDKLLCELANTILKETRKVDLAVRYGGEEFLLLLNGDMKGAHILAEKIRKTVEAKLGITISVGISTSYQGTEEEDELINKADSALYEAKQKGKNRVEVSA